VPAIRPEIQAFGDGHPDEGYIPSLGRGSIGSQKNLRGPHINRVRKAVLANLKKLSIKSPMLKELELACVWKITC
jgi:hypothetical protein